jgi:hypothetical protein
MQDPLKTFPTCRTCVHAEITPSRKFGPEPYMIDPEYVFCHWVPTTDGAVKPKLDNFFCSEHETKYGERFVNWGSK